MPVLFIGHGSPMNAIEDNDFTRALQALGAKLPAPRAILSVSAHWMTKGTYVTAMAHPQTIHDFGGFPQALFDVQYPAPGSPETARLVQSTVSDPEIGADAQEWGLDHGTWSVLRHLYPDARVPVVQLSLDMTHPGAYHLELGAQLRALRDQGILILGSGNIVHNLRQIRWEANAPAYDWALEFDSWVKQKLLARDFKALAQDYLTTPAGRLAVPTPDHYYPLLYVLGAAVPTDAEDALSFEYEGMQNGSISMRAVGFGV